MLVLVYYKRIFPARIEDHSLSEPTESFIAHIPLPMIFASRGISTFFRSYHRSFCLSPRSPCKACSPP